MSSKRHQGGMTAVPPEFAQKLRALIGDKHPHSLNAGKRQKLLTRRKRREFHIRGSEATFRRAVCSAYTGRGTLFDTGNERTPPHHSLF